MTDQERDLAAWLDGLPAPTADPATCLHPAHGAFVAVNRLTDVGLTSADLVIVCVDCRVRFRFVGLPAGWSPAHPCVAIDGTELHLPIEPAVEPQLLPSATFTIPPSVHAAPPDPRAAAAEVLKDLPRRIAEALSWRRPGQKDRLH